MRENSAQGILWKRPWFVVAVISLLGAAWRLYLFSGDGLGDDIKFFSTYYQMFSSGQWEPYAYDYRLGLCLPILLAWKLFGVTELTWILPITVASVVCIPLTYLLGQRLFSRRVGLIAAALLAVHPFDVLTSTLFVNDVPFSLYVTLAILFFLAGLQCEQRHRRLWFVLSSFFVFWSYMTKMWGIFTIPILGLISIVNWRHWKPMLTFYFSLMVFLGTSFLVDWGLTGDPFGYYHAEITIAGLHKVNAEVLLEYPRQMFLPNLYGHFFHGLYCWFAIPALCAAIWKWRNAHVPVIWLVVVFLAMEFMPQKMTLEGWYSQVRIFRYLGVLVVPCCILLAFSADTMISRFPKLGRLALTVFICAALIHGYRLTWPSRDAFDDVRTAARIAVDLPRKPIHSDFMMMSHIERFHFQYKTPFVVKFIRSEEPAERRAEFLEIHNGYVITGGARLPYYGCNHCVANIGSFSIPTNWKPVWMMEKPVTPWRREPIRIWEVGPSLVLEEEISKYKDVGELYNAALAYFFEEHYAEARVMLKRVVEAPPSRVRPWAWWYYGITLMRQGYLKEALTEFKDWLACYPEHELKATIYYHIAMSHKLAGQIDEAKNVFEYVVHTFPDSPDARHSAHALHEIRKREKGPSNGS